MVPNYTLPLGTWLLVATLSFRLPCSTHLSCLGPFSLLQRGKLELDGNPQRLSNIGELPLNQSLIPTTNAIR